MIQILPFPGAVVRAEWARRVISPMHDQIQPKIREQILRSNPYSYLHVTRQASEDDAVAVHGQNRAALARLLDAGAFRNFEEPALFVYRLREVGHVQTGIVAEIPVQSFAENRIRGHEAVQPDRVDALVRHFTAVPVRSDLVALAHSADAELAAIVKATCDSRPILRVGFDDGLEQTVWRINDSEFMATVRARLERLSLYITDGHHRVAAAIRSWRDAGSLPDRAIPSVLFPDDELRILAFHRRVVGPVAPAETIDRLSDVTIVEPVDGPVRERGAVGMYLAGHWYRLALPDPVEPSVVASLDVARLHSFLLEPLLGLDSSDVSHLEFASELVPVDELVQRCDDDGGALFLLCPPKLREIVDAADRSDVFPPKTTYFAPKPWSGLFLRFPSNTDTRHRHQPSQVTPGTDRRHEVG